MAKRRRFTVDSLAGLLPGAWVALAPGEVQHARVLRLKAGAALELFDGEGRVCAATLHEDGTSAVLSEGAKTVPNGSAEQGLRLILATAWPKGKRAAVLIEKCVELGVSEIVPLRCSRSVVVKDDDAQGLLRLRRIAAEAAKQCGRADVPLISGERSFGQLIMEESGHAVAVLLDPGAPVSLLSVLRQEEALLSAETPKPLLCLVGPEGGFTEEELDLVDRSGIRRASLGAHVLRVETAALAACAVVAAWRSR